MDSEGPTRDDPDLRRSCGLGVKGREPDDRLVEVLTSMEEHGLTLWKGLASCS